MAINKVLFGLDTLIDLSGDTVAADKVAEGIIFHATAPLSLYSRNGGEWGTYEYIIIG